MGCNCNKGKKATSAASAARKPSTPPNSGAENQNGGARTTSTSGKTQQFALLLNTGQTLRYGSKLEADAENVRRGYVGRVQPL